jgi:malate permease and related proteins
MVITSFSLTYDENTRGNVAKAFYYSFVVYIIMIIESKLLMTPVKSERMIISTFQIYLLILASLVFLY